MDLKISQLPSLSAATNGSLFAVVEGSTTYKASRELLVPRAYGNYIDTTTHSILQNSASTVPIATVLSEYGMTLSADTITFTSGGTFMIAVSYQFSQTSGSGDIVFWFAKDGSPLTNSATHQFMQNNSKHTAMVSIIETFNAGQTIQLKIQSTSSNSSVSTIAASGSVPQAPGVILNIIQIY